MNVLLGGAYWPNLHYFYYLLHAEHLTIEQHDSYQKQSYRNRCRILSANGPLDLCIPIRKALPGQKLKDVQIADTDNWRMRHWRAITSAYRNSPYFEFFEADIWSFYSAPCGPLLTYQLQQLTVLLRLLRVKKEIALTTDYEKAPLQVLDLRETIHPKRDYRGDARVAGVLNQPYYQTFGGKLAFAANLSVLDLLFNLGLDALSYLDLPGTPKAG